MLEGRTYWVEKIGHLKLVKYSLLSFGVYVIGYGDCWRVLSIRYSTLGVCMLEYTMAVRKDFRKALDHPKFDNK